MSLKNGTKKTVTTVKCTLDNAYVITLVGQLEQSRTQTEVKLVINKTTPGGKVLEEYDNTTVCGLFDNQRGLRKELYMGWSICHPNDEYDLNTGIRYAKKHFSRPIVTYNFTYLNKDQIDCLMRNEIDYIVKKEFGENVKIKTYEIF